VQGELLQRYAQLIVEIGANVQPGQQVLVIASPASAPLVRAVATACYRRGALFVDPWYFDSDVKRERALLAAEETLDFVPPWYATRLLELGAAHGARISISPTTTPGLLGDVDPARAGRDQLPSIPEHLQVINARTTNWVVVPWATPAWAQLVHPDLEADAALERLWDELLFVLRFDEDDPAAAWIERFAELHEVALRVDAANFDALRFRGGGTDLTVGLLATSSFAQGEPGMTTVDGVTHNPNIPSEEIFTTPDPLRVEGVVRATKPLDIGGTTITGLEITFEAGRAVKIDAERGADALRARCAKDPGASRLGEVALVDGDGRIGKTGTTFFNTLLDENAASHLALGSAYAIAVADEDRDRINESGIHIDFMIGGDELVVSGITRDGTEVPVLARGRWQL